MNLNSLTKTIVEENEADPMLISYSLENNPLFSKICNNMQKPKKPPPNKPDRPAGGATEDHAKQVTHTSIARNYLMSMI